MTDDTKMNLESMDVAEEKRQQLKLLFPEVFSEDKVDFDALQRVLGDMVDSDKERFGLNWPGKADCMKVIQAPSVATLKPCRDESENFDETENLFIEGDNLEVLKLLQKSYFSKIKMIYIDPPYNTGKEFIYPDKYAENLDTYLAYTGQVDDEGKKFTTNTDATGRYHSNWLNMMYPRIYLAKNLLCEEGIIVISIDDHECSRLRELLDQTFGEENFITEVAWQKKVSPSNDAKTFSYDHEYLLFYAKNMEVAKVNRLEMNERQRGYYKNPDKDPRGDWNSASYTCNKSRAERPNLFYPIINPNTGEEVWPRETAVWGYGKEICDQHLAEKRLYWGKDGLSKSPRFKKFLSDAKKIVPRSVWLYDEVGHTQMATQELVKLFDGASPFPTPKPTPLLKKIATIASDENSIILDFFGGSCATVDAVMKLNKEDGGKRKFIMVQLPEPCSEDSQAYKLGLKTIADIGKERIRRAAKQIEGDAEGKLEFDDPKTSDLGFKVLKLDHSNFNIWEGDADTFDDNGDQLEMHVDHVSKEASAEDILYELLLKAGFELTTKIEKRNIAGNEVFAVAEGALLICLEKEVTADLIDALAEADPIQVICLDEAFQGNDQLKTNAVQTFASRAAAQESEIVFRTV